MVRLRVLVLVAVLAATCGSPRSSWSQADAWSTGLDDLRFELGGLGLTLFLSPDVTWDVESVVRLSDPMRGADVHSILDALPAESVTRLESPRTFIDSDGVMLMTRIDWGPAGQDQLAPDLRMPAYVLDILDPIEVDGARRMTSAMSIRDWRDRRPDWNQSEVAARIADAWISLWSLGGGDDVAAVYGETPVLVDSIRGISVEGQGGIGRLVDQERGDWAVAEIADGVDAIFPFVHGSHVSDLDSVALVLRATDPDQCPRHLGIWLSIGDGLIAEERRFWSIDDAQACLDSQAPVAGWWDEAVLPEPAEPDAVAEDLNAPTEPLELEDGTHVPIYNGHPKLNALLGWAVDRFGAAGLAPPKIGTVTFTIYSDFCDDALARTMITDDSRDLFFCFHTEDACDDAGCTRFTRRTREAVLHELAHLWMHENLNETTRGRFTEHVGLDAWSDRGVEWPERAAEHAAEIIAWGLMDEPMQMVRIGDPAQDALQAGYRLLTGRDAPAR